MELEARCLLCPSSTARPLWMPTPTFDFDNRLNDLQEGDPSSTLHVPRGPSYRLADHRALGATKGPPHPSAASPSPYTCRQLSDPLDTSPASGDGPRRLDSHAHIETGLSQDSRMKPHPRFAHSIYYLSRLLIIEHGESDFIQDEEFIDRISNRMSNLLALTLSWSWTSILFMSHSTAIPSRQRIRDEILSLPATAKRRDRDATHRK